MNNTIILEVENLEKKYSKFQLKKTSFILRKGTITGFIGRNGAGKSTTMKSILGLVIYDSGKIKYNLHKVGSRFSIGYLGMEKTIYPDESLKSISKLVARAWKNHWNEAEYKYYMDEVFNLDPTKKVSELSTGMLIKFLIALELAKNPELLILDEPTSGLDPMIRIELLNILKELVKNKQLTILFSSHIMEDIVKIADQIVFIDEGEILLTGSIDEIIGRYRKVEQKSFFEISDRLVEIIRKCGDVCGDDFIIENAVLKKYEMEFEICGKIELKEASLEEIVVAMGGRNNG